MGNMYNVEYVELFHGRSYHTGIKKDKITVSISRPSPNIIGHCFLSLRKFWSEAERDIVINFICEQRNIGRLNEEDFRGLYKSIKMKYIDEGADRREGVNPNIHSLVYSEIKDILWDLIDGEYKNIIIQTSTPVEDERHDVDPKNLEFEESTDAQDLVPYYRKFMSGWDILDDIKEHDIEFIKSLELKKFKD